MEEPDLGLRFSSDGRVSMAQKLQAAQKILHPRRVSGHEFIRAVPGLYNWGFKPLRLFTSSFSEDRSFAKTNKMWVPHSLWSTQVARCLRRVARGTKGG